MKNKTLRIFCQGYRPFILGGNVHTMLFIETDKVDGPFNLGKGIEVYLVKSPSGKEYVVDAVSGGIIGDSLDVVRKEILDADIKFMKQQQQDCIKQQHDAVVTSEEDFWRGFK